MQHQKWELQLIGANQFFRQRADRIRVKLPVRGGEIDEIICVRENRQQFAALLMFAEGPDFFAGKRACEPLHVVFYEDLNGCAVDRASALNRRVDATGNRHVRAKKDWMSRFFFLHY